MSSSRSLRFLVHNVMDALVHGQHRRARGIVVNLKSRINAKEDSTALRTMKSLTILIVTWMVAHGV